jgi:hypothetical protein
LPDSGIFARAVANPELPAPEWSPPLLHPTTVNKTTATISERRGFKIPPAAAYVADPIPP